MVAYHNLSDERLVALLKDSDPKAFAAIYERYAESLAGFAGSKLYNLDDARDILHDLFTKLWESREQLNITTSLQSFLFGILRHRIIDKIRKNIVREDYAAVYQSLNNTFFENAGRELEFKDLLQTVAKSLDELPPRVKEIYKLSREEGLSNREIAEKLNLSEQTVKNQLTVALKHLRKALNYGSAMALLFYWWL